MNSAISRSVGNRLHNVTESIRPDVHPAAPSPDAVHRPLVARLLALAGELLLTLGLVTLLFTGYELWGTGSYTRGAQHALDRQLGGLWGRPGYGHEGDVVPGGADVFARADGEPYAVIRIPRLGRHYRFVIVQGTTATDLRKGPGHFRSSGRPGRRGNFVVSGHRTTYLAPFNRIGELRRGDRILVETNAHRYVYRVTGKRVVLPTDLAVTLPVPMRPHMAPRHSWITLTTCTPKYSASHRLIVFGRLAATRAR